MSEQKPIRQLFQMPTDKEIDRLRKCIVCLKCGGNVGCYEHLSEGRKTSQSCEKCGSGHTFIVRENGVDIWLNGKEATFTVALLKLIRGYGDIYFLVKHYHFSSHNEDDEEERNKYFFEEHECPMNIIKSVQQVVMVWDGEELPDDDAHGLFEYLGEVDKLKPGIIKYDGIEPDTDDIRSEHYGQLIEAAKSIKENEQ